MSALVDMACTSGQSTSDRLSRRKQGVQICSNRELPTSRCKSAANGRRKLVALGGNWWERFRLKCAVGPSLGWISKPPH